MKLCKVRIQHYRSIVDSGLVDIEERVTVLIGMNEQGKTTFLKGIGSFARSRTYAPNDFPNHLRVDLEGKDPSTIPVATLHFLLEPDEGGEINSVVDNPEPIHRIVITKYRDGHYVYAAENPGDIEETLLFKTQDITANIEAIKIITDNLKQNLMGHSTRQGAFTPHLPQALKQIENFSTANFSVLAQLDDLTKTFITSLSGVPGIDQPIQADLAASFKEIRSVVDTIKSTLKKNPLTKLWGMLPQFVIHSITIDKIPNEVTLSDFISNPDGTSPGMAKLCRASGITVQKIQALSAMDAADREAYEDNYRANISGAINEYWTQETYNVHFRIEKDKLSVSISDGKYAPRIPPSDRSDGFQWYLSFYSTLLDEASTQGNIILLLDNPALELHADGQRDIKKFLEERYSSTAQVIYVTHSSAMIDPYHLEQVRCVTKTDKGTVVNKLKTKGPKDFDLLEPVRSAIGASLVSSLAYNKVNILTEGAADKPLLDASVSAFRGHLRDTWIVNGGVAEGKEYLPMFLELANIPYVIYLDSDSGGRELKKLLTAGGVPGNRIVMLRDAMGDDFYKGQDIEIEDLVSIEFYHQAVCDTYPNKPVEKLSEGRQKQSKYYEEKYREIHKIGFNKTRVAEKLKRLIEDKKYDEITKNNLERLIAFIEAKLGEKH